MPYRIEKHGDKYWVVKATTGAKVAEHATEEKAKSQMRLLYGVEHGMKPRK